MLHEKTGKSFTQQSLTILLTRSSTQRERITLTSQLWPFPITLCGPTYLFPITLCGLEEVKKEERKKREKERERRKKEETKKENGKENAALDYFLVDER